MRPPRFSIVVACYNQRHFVQAAVESAISQPHPSKEVIVVDDGSSDGTPEVLDAFGDSIRLVKFAKNHGAPATRNHGSSLATGEYLVFLDGDDVLMPWTLQVYERLITTQSPKIILGRRFYFQGEVPRATAEDVPDRIDFVNYAHWFQKDCEVAFGASSFVVHRNTFWDVGGWSPGIFHLDVTDLLLKLGLAGRTLVILAPPTVWYRKHSANITHSVAGMLRCAQVLLQKERAGEYPGGRKHLFARSTCLGGPMWSWIRRAVGAGLYVEAMKLAGSARFTILAATVRRFIALGRGCRPVQSMELLHD
jgi:glycosyltransferase involved in cell wall biosynthesis